MRHGPDDGFLIEIFCSAGCRTLVRKTSGAASASASMHAPVSVSGIGDCPSTYTGTFSYLGEGEKARVRRRVDGEG